MRGVAAALLMFLTTLPVSAQTAPPGNTANGRNTACPDTGNNANQAPVKGAQPCADGSQNPVPSATSTHGNSGQRRHPPRQ